MGKLKIIFLDTTDTGRYDFFKEKVEEIIGTENNVFVHVPYFLDLKNQMKSDLEFNDLSRVIEHYFPDIDQIYFVKNNLYRNDWEKFGGELSFHVKSTTTASTLDIITYGKIKNIDIIIIMIHEKSGAGIDGSAEITKKNLRQAKEPQVEDIGNFFHKYIENRKT